MIENINSILNNLPANVTLIAVSKMHSIEEINEVYQTGILNFGENKVQELISKQPFLPEDIKWHLIGHLQTNKVKYIAPFVHLIQSVDSLKLLLEIDKQAKKNNRIIDCLLQIYIAAEESKFGLTFQEAEVLLNSTEYKSLTNIRISGLMGMASFVDDNLIIRKEFRSLNQYFKRIKQLYFHSNEHFSILSMGMTGDYMIAIEEGSNMIRLGTAIFGQRNYKK